MEIGLVRDLIKSRKDNLLLNLVFQIGNTAAHIYQDFNLDELDEIYLKSGFHLCSGAELEISSSSVTELKLESLRALLKSKYNTNLDFHQIGGIYVVTVRT